MSKLYNKYLEKKKESSNKVFIFKSGSFYIFLGEDANIMTKELGLKLVKFSNLCNKCGFPVKELDKYLKFIKLLKYDYEIILGAVDYIIDDILKLDELTKDEALIKIKNYKEILLNE